MSAGHRRRDRRLVLVAGVLLAAGAVRGDQIITAKNNYTGANIVDFDRGNVHFRTAGGALRREWVGDIKQLVVSRGGAFDDLNQAERFYQAGQTERALIRYRRAIRVAEGFWEALIACRLVRACDQAEQLDATIRHLIVVLLSGWGGPEAVARLIPKHMPSQRTRRSVRAVEQLDTALARHPSDAHCAVLELIRFEILRRTNDERMTRSAAPVAYSVIPIDARFEAFFQIQLEAARIAQGQAVTAELLVGLDHAIRHAPDSVLADFLILKGRASMQIAESREDVLRASWPFLRAAIHFPDTASAAEGLLLAAGALERADKRDKANQLLEECLAHEQVSDETRARAETARQRLNLMPPSDSG